MAMDNQSEIGFLILQGTLPWQVGKPIFVVAERRLVAQPGGLTLGFALHLVVSALVRYQVGLG